MKYVYILLLNLLCLSFSAFGQNCDQLSTHFQAGNSFAGNMFDITVSGNNDLEIDGFEVHIGSGTATISVYYKLGSYVGSESTMSDWTLLGSDTVTGLGLNTPTPVNITGLTMASGSNYGFYVTNSSYSSQAVSMYYTNGSNTFTNADLTLVSGSGLGAPDFSGTGINPNRIWNGTIEYCYGCASPSNIAVSNITDNSADFSWTVSSTETNGYSWVIMNAGDDPDMDIPEQSGVTLTGVNTLSITNLNSETDYDFYIKSDCGSDGLSNWSQGLNFLTPTSCLAPTNLILDNLSDVSADISWTLSPDEISGYEWFIFITAADPDIDTPVLSGVTSAGDSSVNISNLSSNTTYDFYLSADCDIDGLSKLEGPLTFTTLCSPFSSFPFIEDFESTSTTLACWSQIQEDGTANWTFEEGSSAGSITTANSGIQNARFVSVQSINTPITKLVSPIFDLTSLNNPTLSFYYGQENYVGDQNEMKVYYRESSASSWLEIAHYTGNVDNWTQEILILPNPSSSYQIAFEGINYFGRANVLDDVLIEDNLAVTSQNFDKIDIYPNPTNSNVNFSAGGMIQELKVFNVLGKEVYNVTPNQTDYEMNFSNLNSGVYFIKATINNQTKSFKVIKE